MKQRRTEDMVLSEVGWLSADGIGTKVRGVQIIENGDGYGSVRFRREHRFFTIADPRRSTAGTFEIDCEAQITLAVGSYYELSTQSGVRIGELFYPQAEHQRRIIITEIEWNSDLKSLRCTFVSVP